MSIDPSWPDPYHIKPLSHIITVHNRVVFGNFMKNLFFYQEHDLLTYAMRYAVYYDKNLSETTHQVGNIAKNS